MNNDLYRKLVDLYAGDELPEELKDELESAALTDQALAADMQTLRGLVRNLQESPKPELTEEASQRILMRIRARGVEIDTRSPEPSHLQYALPIQG
jgi:anti-sigma factor RsiW